MLTIKEISDRLNIPESTLRYYREQYEECLPVVGQGRQRRYKEEAVELFATISDLTRQGADKKAIKTVLSVKTMDIAVDISEPRTQEQNEQHQGVQSAVDIAVTPTAELQQLDRNQQQILSTFNSFTEKLQVMNEMIASQTAQIATQTREIAELKEMIRLQSQAAEIAHMERSEKKRSLFQWLLGK